MVAALFVNDKSVYKVLLGAARCYDRWRNAITFPGGMPVVMHPPCRHFCSLAGSFPCDENEKQAEMKMVINAVAIVQKNGEVLEHPAKSALWNAAGLPYPGECADKYGGITIECKQYDFGHPAEKNTWLYIVGYPGIPKLPPRREGKGLTTMWSRGHHGRGVKMARLWRTATPTRFAQFLIGIAERCKR